MVAETAQTPAASEVASQAKPAARCPFRGWFGGTPAPGDSCPFSGRGAGVASADRGAAPGAPGAGSGTSDAAPPTGSDLSSCPHMKQNAHASAQDAAKCPHVRRVAAQAASAAAQGGAGGEAALGEAGDPAACPHLQRVAAEVAKAQGGLDPSACPHLAKMAGAASGPAGAAAAGKATGGAEDAVGTGGSAGRGGDSPTSPLSPAAARCPHLRALHAGAAGQEAAGSAQGGAEGGDPLAAGAAAAYPPEVLAQCPHLRQMAGGAGVPSASPAASGPAGPAAPSTAWAPPLAGGGAGEVRCPLGFGAKRAALSELHCALCKGLYHRATRLTPCGHLYCAGCVRPARSCPTCGADVEGREEVEEVQRAVDAFLKDECGRHSIWDLDSAAAWEAGRVRAEAIGARDEGPAAELCVRGSFLMALALRQGGAGNSEAAGERLFMAIQAFEQAKDAWVEDGAAEAEGAASAPPPAAQLDITAPPSTLPELFERLGTAWGALGDLARSGGDAGAAGAAYASAAAALGAAVQAAAPPGASPAAASSASPVARSAQRALLVTRNKQGDLCYALGDARGALALYGESLRGRREARARAPGDPAVGLDLVTSLVKVADALQWARECGAPAGEGAEGAAEEDALASAEPGELLREAKALVDAIERGAAAEPGQGGDAQDRPLDGVERRKLAALQAHLARADT